MPRDVWKPNVTVAAVIEREGRFLLIEEEAQGRLVLNQPAGHWEPGESLIEASQREAMEESAHAFTPRALVGIYRAWAEPEEVVYLRFAFCGEAGAHDPTRTLDRGITRAVWMSADEIRASAGRHRSPLVLRCVEDYLAGRRYPLDILTHLA
jgi:ADP-ribose pyrophosphatase YjhB (NUDIX family)